MHSSARKHCARFFDAYVSSLQGEPLRPLRVGEIGAQDVNGSLRSICPEGVNYVGFDIEAGANVDHVMKDPYIIPAQDATFDVILSTSCFEHTPLFWLMFQEIMRVLKPDGLFYLCAPANGDFHRYPVDCWRFYPDSGFALVEWGVRCGLSPALLESYTGHQDGDFWNDFVAVFIKSRQEVGRFPNRILDKLTAYDNGYVHGDQQFRHMKGRIEDGRKLDYLARALKL